MVSVIMITYNHEKYIREAIEGVLMQNVNFELELIIADDNSPDNTEQVVLDIASSHPNGKWIKYTKHKKNKGIMPNFIWALEQCKGKYIAMCEGDDYWTDLYKLQKQVDFLEGNEDVAGAFTDTMILENGVSSLWRKNLKTRMVFKDTVSISAPFHTSSFLFRKDTFNNIKYDIFNNVQSGDMLLFSLVASNGYLVKIECSPTVYRKHEGGVTNTSIHKLHLFQLNRIQLWLTVKQHVNHDHDHINNVILTHWFEIMRASGLPHHQLLTRITFNKVIKLIGMKKTALILLRLLASKLKIPIFKN